jgi:hypothetical protein
MGSYEPPMGHEDQASGQSDRGRAGLVAGVTDSLCALGRQFPEGCLQAPAPKEMMMGTPE